ncbi:MAG: 4Fe-4S binding protein [Gammaproteobacteria bacterium]|nr:4Fe-4S binding protein [Gammaproteobacteria bacterium]
MVDVERSVTAAALQRRRLMTRLAFFALFVLAPPLDLFRLDLHRGHFVLMGMDWTLGLAAFQAGAIGPLEAAGNLVLRGFLPIALLVGTFFWIARRYGRLYCGWLCPHFSVVELINGLLRRAIGRPTVWERAVAPQRRPDGSLESRGPLWWLVALPVIAIFSLLWAVVLLTYLLPPTEVYGNLVQGTLTRNQATFITAATLAFVVEFTLARHLFCRYGCAVGLFQSYVWMFNRRGMVVGFDRTRSDACANCRDACEHACPMRLKPRASKRHVFSCTQCARCIQACAEVQRDNPQGPLLGWVRESCAEDAAWSGFGPRPTCEDPNCHLLHRRGGSIVTLERRTTGSRGRS